MANFFVVFGEQSSGRELPPGSEFEGDKTLEYVKTAKVLKVEASSLLKAQVLVEHFMAGEITGTPVVVTEAQWKTS